MRRNEFEITDKETIHTLLNECEYGTLSLIDNNVPYGIPLNFVWWEEGVVFHGAKEGKKIELIAQNPNASLSIVKPYSLLPSYFSETTSACPASQLYASIIMQGVITIIDTNEQKASALNALMEKLQPEKRYETITAENPMYKKRIEEIMILKLIPKSISCKLKMGQNLPPERKKLLLKHLEKRGTPLDLLSASAIRQLS
jgi:nitroimidazol reductase NimA-like FMN-containing flavoprotein (pyridoxamine 5'-phosphate oxidase superfamily)